MSGHLFVTFAGLKNEAENNNQMTVKELNRQFAIEGFLTFVEGYGEMAIAMVSNDFASSQISVYGAHVMSYEPADKDDALMMCHKSAYQKGKPLRGGIPLCFPWFGANSTDNRLPSHGFARLMDWNVKGASQLDNGATQIVFYLTDSVVTRKMWPYSFRTELTITVGETLEMSWTTFNTGKESFPLTSALHSYFATEDVTMLSVKGLQGVTYLDNLNQLEPIVEENEAIIIDKEVNRCYMDTDAECVIEDASLDRTIRIRKRGSKSTVVWNPWIETAKSITDMSNNEYLEFVCVETANVHHNKVVVAPGESQTISLSISVE
jgi:glucose-6-phosphate 1-epimerase